MFYYKKIPRIIQQLFPSIHWRGKLRGKSIFLSFDDGPDPDSTPVILDLLKQYDIKASFFCLGVQAEKYPDLLARIQAEGHLIGNHGYAHLNGWKSSFSEYIANVERGARLLGSRYFRPPYGRITPGQFRRLKKNHRIVLWDLMPGDFLPGSKPEEMLDFLKRHLKAGSLIVLHDKARTMESLLLLLPELFQLARERELTWKRIGE